MAINKHKTNHYQRDERNIPGRGLAHALSFIFLATVLINSLCSCKTKRYVSVENVKTQVTGKQKIVHDTIRDTVLSRSFVYRQDSMSVSKKGDTVFVERWHVTRIGATEKRHTTQGTAIRDTVFVFKTDTVRVPVPVGKGPTKWEAFGTSMRALTVVLVILTVIVILWWIKKRIRSNA